MLICQMLDLPHGLKNTDTTQQILDELSWNISNFLLEPTEGIGLNEAKTLRKFICIHIYFDEVNCFLCSPNGL